jgi:hypothetical protein
MEMGHHLPMRNLGVLLLFGTIITGAAQTQPAASGPGQSPPPEVDAALRGRVTDFFQAQVEGKFRQAEQYVAEDTKDFYYAMYKAKYLKFAIVKISYSDNFTKAKVTLQTEREVAQAMIPSMKVNLREDTDWKIENGLWCWTHDRREVRTPFNASSTGPTQAGSTASNPAATQDLAETVSADKKDIRLNERLTSDVVVLRNELAGFVSLQLVVPEAPGLTARLDHEQVGPNGIARVFFSYKPTAAAVKEVVVNVVVQPTNQTVPIRVTMEPPILPAN